MKIELTKEDNDIIVYHLYKYSDGFSDITDRKAMDFYINTIEFLENDTILKGFRIKQIPFDDVREENILWRIGKSRGDLGDYLEIILSEFDKEYINSLKAAIREIKLKKIVGI